MVPCTLQNMTGLDNLEAMDTKVGHLREVVGNIAHRPTDPYPFVICVFHGG